MKEIIAIKFDIILSDILTNYMEGAQRIFTIRGCPLLSQYQYLTPNRRHYSKRGKEFITNFTAQVYRQIEENQYQTMQSCNIECAVIMYFNNKRLNDLDNNVKPVLDNLQRCGVFRNDGHITKLMIEKKYVKTKILDVNCEIYLRCRDHIAHESTAAITGSISALPITRPSTNDTVAIVDSDADI
jgi:Holliday junction resolvase RusA-like endonuclease